ncbi:MAG: hypothetical protein DRJ96_07695 [Thermoprotei archaeon]|nr:MAG: hypothetical protein DRJ96_07695 [Thermoprotei archaeon]
MSRRLGLRLVTEDGGLAEYPEALRVEDLVKAPQRALKSVHARGAEACPQDPHGDQGPHLRLIY